MRRGRIGLLAGLSVLLATAEAAAFRPSLMAEAAVGPLPVVAPPPEFDALPPEPEGRIEVLSPTDAARYAEILQLQEQGKWPAADKLIEQLEDKRLLGHLLAQRYLHPTRYRSSYRELSAWLADYADHPDARRIYALALKRKPAGARPQRPVMKAGSLAAPAPGALPYRSEKKLSRSQHRRVAQLQAQIRRNLRRTRLSVTEDLLASAEVRRLFDSVQIDDAKTNLGAAWFYYGNDEKAFTLAGAAADRSGAQVPIAHWIAGLAAWRLDRLDAAARHFEALALSREASAWNSSAGAYWAARTRAELGQPDQVDRWLAVAAGHPRTFYGLIARHALGFPAALHFDSSRLTRSHVEALAALPEGGRALALIQVGEHHRAERELLQVARWKEPALAEALLALAQRAHLPTFGFKLAQRLVDEVGGEWSEERLDAWLYPIPAWVPPDGFIVDRALVYALMRQESAFNPLAMSPDGARGLMQLMPRTASFISDGRRFRGSARRDLFDPELNIELGQRYLAHLLDHRGVEGDLFRLAVAYNGGPGNLAKWQRRMDYGDDPLLFIESLPTKETRLFIERVLTNLWIYRERLGQPSPSLAAIAAGRWPAYQALDLEEQVDAAASGTQAQGTWWVLR